MNDTVEFNLEAYSDLILSSQYNDLFRRPSAAAEGEYRLLWAVLENAVRAYLANRGCSNLIQRKRFEEVHNWFELQHDEHRNLFSIQNICGLLGIDSGRLLKGLKSASAARELPRRRQVPRELRQQGLAA